MDAAILFSHGSVLCGSGEALLAHAERLRMRGVAPLVAVGYLNYSEPPFADAVEDVVRKGATRVLVTPYFLAPGKFVKVDLPQAVDAVRAAHPGVEFLLTEAIGYDERLADALIESARAANGPSAWRDDLKRAARHCRANPDCPLYGAPACPAQGRGKREKGKERIQIPEHPNAEYLNTEHRTPNTALLVMVHGSPRPIANADMFRVVEVVRQRGVFPIVEVGFMECNEPDIPTAIGACVVQGATEVIAVPYFLHTGAHVADDLPTLLEQAQERHPGIAFRMGDYLGRSERVTDILQDRVLTTEAAF
jgi:sirohydrochlorin cobaltochelatase